MLFKKMCELEKIINLNGVCGQIVARLYLSLEFALTEQSVNVAKKCVSNVVMSGTLEPANMRERLHFKRGKPLTQWSQSAPTAEL